MLPPDFLESLPGNLSRLAAKDLVAILRRSAETFGVGVARASRDRLIARCRAIHDGVAIGHTRQDVPTARPVLFLVEEPWVVAFDPETRMVLRIVHGGQNFRKLFTAS